MQRALGTTAAAIALTALAVSTVGCGNSPALSARAGGPGPSRDRPAVVTDAGPGAAQVYILVLRRYLRTPGDNSFPAHTFKTAYVLDRAYADAADPQGAHKRGVAIAPRAQRQVVAALAGTAHVIFVAHRGSVTEDKGGCRRVKNGGILITLGRPVGHGNQVRVAIGGFAACLGATWLTYVLKDQRGAGWRVTGTTGPKAIS